MSARSELDDLLYNEGSAAVVTIRPRLLALIDALSDEFEDRYSDGYETGYDEGYSTGYDAAIDEASWRCEREHKDDE